MSRWPDKTSARSEIEALYERHRSAQRGPIRYSLEDHLKLVGLMVGYEGSLDELAAELDLPLDYVKTLETYLVDWEGVGQRRH